MNVIQTLFKLLIISLFNASDSIILKLVILKFTFI